MRADTLDVTIVELEENLRAKHSPLSADNTSNRVKSRRIENVI